MDTGDTIQVKDSALGMGNALTPALLVTRLNMPNKFTVLATRRADGDTLYLTLECCREIKDAAGFDVCHAHAADFFEPYVPPPPVPLHDAQTVIETPFLHEPLLELGHYTRDGGLLRAKVPGIGPLVFKGTLANILGGVLREVGLL